MNCSEEGEFCTETESLFFNVMQQISNVFQCRLNEGRGALCLPVHFFFFLMCIYSVSEHACIFN